MTSSILARLHRSAASPRHPRGQQIATLVVILALAFRLAAQGTATTTQNFESAVTAWRLGDTAGALAKLQGNVRTGPNEPNADLQFGRQLAAVACALKNSGYAVRARDAANLALVKVALPEGRMNAREAVAALVLSAELSELKGDVATARIKYQRALALDPQLHQVAQRLARMKAREDRSAAKPVVNEMLKARAANPGR